MEILILLDEGGLIAAFCLINLFQDPQTLRLSRQDLPDQRCRRRQIQNQPQFKNFVDSLRGGRIDFFIG